MKKKIFLRIVSLLVILGMYFSLCPLQNAEAVVTPAADAGQIDINDFFAGLLSSDEVISLLDKNTVPDIVGYDEAVAQSHIKRLYDEEGNDLYTIIFLNVDGTKTMYKYDFPVKYVDDSGVIQDITLQITDSERGTEKFKTANNSTITTFSRYLTDGISLMGNETNITLIPALPESQRLARTASPDTPEQQREVQRIDEDTISYPYDDRTTIEYSLTYTGFKEDIVVSEYTGQTEYPFTLYTNGYSLTNIGGSFYLTDNNQNIRASIGDIIIFTADQKNNTTGKIIPTTIVENEEYLLTIVVDEDFLSDENTLYPIRIDPTVEVNYNNNGAGAIEDVTIHSTGSSNGSSGSLYIGVREGSGISRALMKFPGLNVNSLGTNAEVQSATVTLRDLMCESTPLHIDCYIFAGNIWNESTANWSNVAYKTSTHLSSNVFSYDNGANLNTPHRYSFDITKAVQGWIDGSCSQAKGIVFKTETPTEIAGTVISRTVGSYNRSSYKPTLAVTYTTGNSQTIANGTYYLSNKEYGKYLHCVSSTEADACAGRLASLGTSIQWQLKKVKGGYVLQSASNSSYYLGVPYDTSRNTVQIVHVTDAAIPDKCLWMVSPASGGGGLIKNVYNSKYLVATGSTLCTTSSLGSTSSGAYYSAVWRILNVARYGDSSSFELRELSNNSFFEYIELEVSDRVTLAVSKSNPNEIWCDISDFNFSFIAGKISINGDQLNALHRGVVHVLAIHKVTNSTKTFTVFVKNSLLSQSEKSSIRSAFVDKFGDGYNTSPLININTIGASLDEVLRWDETITEYCNDYRIPKEYVQSILFREIHCYNRADILADEAVRCYYAWKNKPSLGDPPEIKTDSSTGLAQIFASTAIQALNHADDRGLYSPEKQYNSEDWRDVEEVWNKLNTDPDFNIMCCALVILDCQYEFEATLPYAEFFDFSESQTKKIIARYNGSGENDGYAQVTYEYFKLFKEYNE